MPIGHKQVPRAVCRDAPRSIKLASPSARQALGCCSAKRALGERPWEKTSKASLDAWPGGTADCVESVLDADRSARRLARALVEAQR